MVIQVRRWVQVFRLLMEVLLKSISRGRFMQEHEPKNLLKSSRAVKNTTTMLKITTEAFDYACRFSSFHPQASPHKLASYQEARLIGSPGRGGEFISK